MSETISVRYMVEDVESAVQWYVKHLGFARLPYGSPAFAAVNKGALRLLLAGKGSSAGRAMPDGEQPKPGGWNRFLFVVEDIEKEVARLRAEGVTIRNEIVRGPGGAQVLAVDPSGNLVEIFQPAVP